MISWAEAQTLLAREALYLDQREWDEWLSLFTEDCTYWMPAWRDEETPTQNPERELSLIWYSGRHNLEDRVWRIRSGLSVASIPLMRTSHHVSNIIVEGDHTVSASFAVHVHNAKKRTDHVFFGRYDYSVRRAGTDWRIAAKKITLMNDVIPAVADFYML